MTEPRAVRVGIAWMLLATVLWVAMDVLNKHLGRDYPVAQVALMRFSLHTALIFVLSAPRLGRLLTTRNWPLQLLRSTFLMSGTVLVVMSFQHLPLLFVSAVSMLVPVVITAISVPLLGEKVGWRRWVGVAAGFFGALIVVGPAGIEVQYVVLLPLLMVLVNAAYQLTTRILGGSDSPHTTILYTGVSGTLVALAVVPLVIAGIVPAEAVWRAPDVAGWAGLLALGILGVISHYCMILAYTAAPASIIAPFAYAGLLWSAVFGFVVFAEVPTLSTAIGALIITGSGLYIWHREQAVGRR